MCFGFVDYGAYAPEKFLMYICSCTPQSGAKRPRRFAPWFIISALA